MNDLLRSPLRKQVSFPQRFDPKTWSISEVESACGSAKCLIWLERCVSLGCKMMVFVVATLVVSLQSVSAQETSTHPVVPGFERFIDVDEITDVERGSLLINETNCHSCHAGGETAMSVAPKKAPILTGVGNRIRPEYFEQFLMDPHGTKPGTTMPDVLQGRSQNDKKKIAESIAHFLAATGSTNDTPPLPAPMAAGEKLFHSIGCIACHDPQNTKSSLPTSVPLGDLSKKYTIPGLVEFLRNPLAIRPSGRMPHLNLDDTEAQQVATYLLRNIKLKSNINVAYYEGSWDKLPDFDSMKPVSKASVPTLNPAVGRRRDNFGLVFTGFWKVAKAGVYKFRVGSDDGSRLLINGKKIVDNDGIHGMVFVEGTHELPVGVHEVRIEFFEKGGGEELAVEVSGAGLPKQSLGGLLKTEKEPPMPEKGFVLNKEKAKLGGVFFQSVGCANCHDLLVDQKKMVSSQPAAKPMADLRPVGGCLDGKASTPRFGWTEKQRRSLVAALKTPPALLRGGNSQSTEDKIGQKMMTLNCYACHERSFVGGVVDRRGESKEVHGHEKWFVSDQPEMGDEGRLPPALTGVGAKLNPAWLAEAMESGAKERPYMMTRMPRFGKSNLGELVSELINADQLTDPVVVEIEMSPRKLKQIGKAFAGTSEKENGLSCIKCHTFGKYKATGIQAISLTTMTKRLNKDWFQKYMLKPSRFRPGTRMPESWPAGKSFFPDVLDGDANKQIASIWDFLSDGERAAKPKGLVQVAMQLVATDRPRIYRNFIEGAGSRAIGIGYPEEVNLAFDANNNRLAMLWYGAFMDPSRHWNGRGQGYQPPLGDNVLKLPEGVAFALPAVAEKEWPKTSAKELGLRFGGYRFNKDREPIFLYRLGDVQISDFPEPNVTEDITNFVRRFEVAATETSSLWYRAAVGSKIILLKDGTFDIGGDYKLKFSDNIRPVVRTSGNQQELLIPLDLTKGAVKFSQEYIW